jgi:hypothetical protein
VVEVVNEVEDVSLEEGELVVVVLELWEKSQADKSKTKSNPLSAKRCRPFGFILHLP